MADSIDGHPASDFLGESAKAADSDLLDGLDSSDFIGGHGSASGGFGTIQLGQSKSVASATSAFSLQFFCPSSTSNESQIILANSSGDTMNVFVDDAQQNLTLYNELGNGSTFVMTPNNDGDMLSYELHLQDGRVITIQAFSKVRASDCVAQAQTLITH